MRILFSKYRSSRQEREFCSLNLEFRDENEIFLSISQGSRRDRDIFFQVSCFEMGLRDEINLILTRIFEIEKSRYALLCLCLYFYLYLCLYVCLQSMIINLCYQRSACKTEATRRRPPAFATRNLCSLPSLIARPHLRHCQTLLVP